MSNITLKHTPSWVTSITDYTVHYLWCVSAAEHHTAEQYYKTFIERDLETIIVFDLLAFNFIFQRSHHSPTLPRLVSLLSSATIQRGCYEQQMSQQIFYSESLLRAADGTTDIISVVDRFTTDNLVTDAGDGATDKKIESSA